MAGLGPNDADLRIAVRVVAARRTSGITQAAAGRVLGVSIAQIQKYERGTNRLTGGMLQALADLFGVPVASFFDPNGSLTSARGLAAQASTSSAVSA